MADRFKKLPDGGGYNIPSKQGKQFCSIVIYSEIYDMVALLDKFFELDHNL
jgi:hypothetical protein